MKTIVAVVGRRSATVPEAKLGARLGRLLAEDGHTILTGGRGGGPTFASQAALDYGGTVVAITPGQLDAEGPATIVVRSGLSFTSRNCVVGAACNAMVALPGSHGTWQEIVCALDNDAPVLLVGEHSQHLPGCIALDHVDDVSPVLRDLFARRTLPT